VLSGAEFVVEELTRRGISIVIGIPGGAILPLYDALTHSGVRHVLARHEQGAGFIAQGMARATGKPAVCLATSGPGVTNLITALADARADSVPLVAITAQVPRALIGTDAFQEVDTCAIARPVTKASFFAGSAAELRRILPHAFDLAASGRPGPVLVDIPKDVFKEQLVRAADGNAPAALAPEPEPSAARIPRVARRLDPKRSTTWREVAALIEQSRRPLLYIGGGIHMSGADRALAELVERADIPVVCSLHGLGSFPAGDPLCLGMLGMHGAPYVNHATEEADLVLAIGARFDDRATGTPEQFCRQARIVHIDIDPRELGKIKPVEIGIAADARSAILGLLEELSPLEHPEWRTRLGELRRQHPLTLQGEACGLLEALDISLRPGTIVTTDVGQHQMWVAQCLKFRTPRTLLTSGGLGTMGFGLPAAIGAALGRPGTPVVCVTGDGSLLMNLQELATLAELRLDVKVLVLNNGQLGLVRQQQQLFYGRRFSAAHFEQRSDFAALAEAFGIRGERARARELDRARIARWLDARGPMLLDAQIDGNENVLPMVPPGASNLEMILHEA
jgi:acetolactate synthase-1/2/3 large subunit